MADEPDWAKVLRVVYKGHLSTIPVPEDDEMTKNHELVKQTELGVEEVNDAINFLVDNDLIHSPNPQFWSLTPDGFDVAHEREMKHQQNKTNLAIAFLTSILAITAMYEALATLVPPFVSTNIYAAVLFFGYAFFVLIVFLKARDWLDISAP